MKNLFFKEFKLSIHPLCYVFTLGFGLMGLIPSYPSYISFFYTIASYTFLFLGANKGVTTNDLFYSVNLPIRRKDIVKARLISISYLHALSLVSTMISLIIKTCFINPSIVAESGEAISIGLDAAQGFVLFGFILISISVYDLIFVPWFYKTGKSIVAPTFVGLLAFIIVASILFFAPMALPSFFEKVTIGGPNSNLLLQLGLLLLGILVYVGARFIIYFASVKNIEKLDF